MIRKLFRSTMPPNATRSDIFWSLLAEANNVNFSAKLNSQSNKIVVFFSLEKEQWSVVQVFEKLETPISALYTKVPWCLRIFRRISKIFRNILLHVKNMCYQLILSRCMLVNINNILKYVGYINLIVWCRIRKIT